MTKYYYTKGQEQVGPVTLEELKKAEIKPDTMVWFEGLSNWEPAEGLEELKGIFELIPPPLQAEVSTSSGESEKSFHDSLPTSERKKQKMFSKVFQPEGRIRRMEYGLSLIIYYLGIVCIGFLMGVLGVTDGETYGVGLLYLAFLPLWFLLFFQGAKRCHDRGNSGWFQIIPFYVFWMVFADGDPGQNKYGPTPKGLQ